MEIKKNKKYYHRAESEESEESEVCGDWEECNEFEVICCLDDAGVKGVQARYQWSRHPVRSALLIREEDLLQAMHFGFGALTTDIVLELLCSDGIVGTTYLFKFILFFALSRFFTVF